MEMGFRARGERLTHMDLYSMHVQECRLSCSAATFMAPIVAFTHCLNLRLSYFLQHPILERSLQNVFILAVRGGNFL